MATEGAVWSYAEDLRRYAAYVCRHTQDGEDVAQNTLMKAAMKIEGFRGEASIRTWLHHGYHWNVTGPMFRSLRLMFEEQYLELATAVDVLAERIRALGVPAPASYSDFSRLASIEGEDGTPDAIERVRRLVDGHETVIRTARAVAAAAEAAGDLATADLATQRIDIHEKTAWMLRATAS